MKHLTFLGRLLIGLLPAGAILLAGPVEAANLDLARAQVLMRSHEAPRVEHTAVQVLVEEVAKRTGITLPTVTAWPESGPVIVVTSGAGPIAGHALPNAKERSRAEAFTVRTDTSKAGAPVVWIVGYDGRGALYGVGYFMRHLLWGKGRIDLPELDVTSAPEYPIRGHQLGYRAQSNTYDAWDPAQYEQYIRDLSFFGCNTIEAIPFQDDRPSKVMKYPREEMNLDISRICDKYDMDFWIWVPADFDLKDTERRAQALQRNEAFYKACPRLDGVFFPGGDPGDNPPQLVIPYLQDLSARLLKYHPKAKIWISLQGFDKKSVDYFYHWVNQHLPDWLGGLVCGPSSPPIPETRARLNKRYGIRNYPDITHCVRAQYPTPWWDPAFAFTLGREPINPEPEHYRYVHNYYAPYTSGFISYSDGAQDDVNKVEWCELGWNSNTDLRTILTDYTRVFFGPEVATKAADGIFALERNWHGPLATNGGVDGTLALWQGLDKAHPELASNWRWQMLLFRAYYDAYTKHRLIYESGLEDQVNATLLKAKKIGVEAAIKRSLAILKLADTHKVHPEWRRRIFALAGQLFHSIGFQTSVKKYGAIGEERGAVLDYVDYPLNNRWWLEDQLDKVATMNSKKQQLARLRVIATWEHPGPGSYYDDIGNVAKSDHVIRGEGVNTDPNLETRAPNPDFMWWNNGMTHVRQSWISWMAWPIGLRYSGMDPSAHYLIRTTGYGRCLLKVDGQRVQPTIDGKGIGEIKEFPVPRVSYAKDGEIVVTFDVPYEPGVNWRKVSRLTEMWLIKNPKKRPAGQ